MKFIITIEFHKSGEHLKKIFEMYEQEHFVKMECFCFIRYDQNGNVRYIYDAPN